MDGLLYYFERVAESVGGMQVGSRDFVPEASSCDVRYVVTWPRTGHDPDKPVCHYSGIWGAVLEAALCERGC